MTVHRVMDNLGYILRHKWHTFRACWRLSGRLRGWPRWRLRMRALVHDLSKFTVSEFVSYGERFHPAKVVEDCSTALHRPGGEDRQFDAAWLHHVHKNDHHWQFWSLVESQTGTACCIQMDVEAAHEMVADWWGAYRARRGGQPVGLWYTENEWRIKLHPLTRELVEALLDEVDRW
jgi:hypothetical protein